MHVPTSIRAVLTAIGCLTASCQSAPTGAGRDTWVGEDTTAGGTHDAVGGGLTVQAGTNPVSAKEAGAFHHLVTGDELTIEWGFQGFMMIVLAARANAPGPQPIWMSSALTLDGEVVASARIREKALVPGGDGWYYSFDHFVLTPDPDPWIMKDLVLSVALEDDAGVLLGESTVEVRVVLPPP
jgi:hypothetical protein